MTKVERLFREFKTRMETKYLSLDASRELVVKETRYHNMMVEQAANKFALKTMNLTIPPAKNDLEDEKYRFFLLTTLYTHAYNTDSVAYSRKIIKKALKVVIHLDSESLYQYLEKYPVDFRGQGSIRYGGYGVSHCYLISEDIIERFRNIEALYE